MSLQIKERLRQRQLELRQSEAEAEASAAKAAADRLTAEQARKEAERAAKEAAAAFKQRERELGGEVEAFEAEAQHALAVSPPDERPLHDLRVAARTWLHESSNGDAVGVFADDVAGPLHHLGWRCTRLLAQVEDELSAGHDLATRADAIEVKLWMAFTDRLRVLAGER